MKTKILSALTLVMVLSMIASSVLAAPAPPAAPSSGSTPDAGNLLQDADAQGPALYIVQLQDAPLASYYGGVESLAPTSPRVTGESKLNMDSAASQAYMDYLDGVQAAMLSTIDQTLGRTVRVHVQWNVAYNGFAIEINPEEAAAVAELEGVRFVQREFMRYPQTDAGPTWIGADNIWNGAATGTLYKGEGVVVGIVDTGLNLGHPSFAATGQDGYVHTNPLGSGNYLGLCASNPGVYVCNNKTYGFYIFTGEVSEDGDGHGSHTGSTTAGNYLVPGTVDLTPFNSYSPAISGVAPHANIIGYKACLDAGGCPGAALVSAINQATANGVDVINYSIGGGTANPWTDADALAFLAAQDAGVVPVTSAGNNGPTPSTVGSPGDAPWMLTVGASTHNRAGLNAVIDMAGGDTTPPPDLSGKGFSLGTGMLPMVYAGNYGDPLCLNPFAPGTFTGQIVVCDRGTNARVAKGYNVLQGGAGGMVLVNTDPGQSLNGDVHWLPAVQLNSVDGTVLKTWMATGSGHMGKIAGTNISFAPSNGDIMAGFSSRGPLVNNASDVIKPDVTAPGVDVLAAYRNLPPGPEDPTQNYAIISGTSMSSPHTAGAAALLKGLHPTWSVAEIKSALMSTGKVAGVVKEDGVTQATPFDMGAGRVQVDRAAATGLVLDVAPGAFQAANPGSGGDPKTLNLASMGNDDCGGTCGWTRTVKATVNGAWTVSTTAPAGMTLTVVPNSFSLTAGQTQQLTITANVTGLPLGVWAFAEVGINPTPIEGTVVDATIHFPVAVKPTSSVAGINVTPTSLAATQLPDTTTNQTLTIGNTGTGQLSWNIAEAPNALLLPTGVSRGMQQAAGSQQVTFGDATLSRSTLTPGQMVTPERSATPDALVTITHSASQAIVTGNSVSCNANNLHTDNSYLRQFDLNAFGITDALAVTQVQVGVEQAIGAGGSQPLTVNLYTKINPAGALTWANLSLIGSAAATVPDQALTLLTVPVVGTAPAGSVLVVEVFTPSGQVAGHSFFVGSNAAGQTAPSYLAAADCGVTEPTDTAAIGFPNMHIVMNVTGDTTQAPAACDNPADVSWLSVTPAAGNTAPGGSTPVTVGFDSTGLAVGSYNAVLCVTSNDPVTPLVEVPVSLTVQAGQPPNINVTPASLSSTQATNTTTQQTLNVGNTGGIDLTWSIFEDVSGRSTLVDWSDNFDSYAAGSELIGQGGWEGWGNNAAAGALVSTVQSHSAPHSAAIVAATDLVHQYSGYTSGVWNYSAWQYIPSDFSGESYFILLNQYTPAGGGDGNWSTQVHFQSTTNLVIGDPGPGNPGGSLPLVKGQWVPISVVIDLDADTQTFYYDNQVLFTGSWTEGQSGAGSLNIAAVDLFANSASVVYYDDLGLAEVLPVACDALADIPWASVAPLNGVTTPAGSTPVQVTFDSTSLANGVYTGNLCVTSNDPDAGPGNGTDLVVVPLTLTIQPPTAVTLDGLAAANSASPAGAGVPLSALPAAAAAAFAAVYALRRRR